MVALEIAFRSHHSEEQEIDPATRAFEQRLHQLAAYRGGLFSNDGDGGYCALLLLDSREAAEALEPQVEAEIKGSTLCDEWLASRIWSESTLMVRLT